MRSLFLLMVPALLSLAVLGCGGEVSDPVAPASGPVPGPRPLVEFEVSPTATAWPTFTPAPTPTPVPEPTLRPTPTRFLVPPVPGPPSEVSSASVPELGDMAQDPEALVVLPVAASPPPATVMAPTPTPFGRIRDYPVYFLRQGFYPLQDGEVPSYVLGEEWSHLPPSFETLLQSTPMALWVVVFDAHDAPEDWRMMGTVRWVNLNREGLRPVVMYEVGQEISRDFPYFARGLGREIAGLWEPGDYRVEFLDDRHELVVDWDFRVR